ncbi:PKD domain-containing protein [bacterium]|nr:PKD domain-containing protein [bacterium]
MGIWHYTPWTVRVGLLAVLLMLLGATAWSAEWNAGPERVEGDGKWMRPSDATYLEWCFTNLEREAFDAGVKVTLELDVTNQRGGGSGYSTAVRVYVINPDGGDEEFNPVWLQNTLPGVTTVSMAPPPAIIANTTPANTYGYGYRTSAEITTSGNLVSQDGELKVRVERDEGFDVDDGNGLWQPHVGYYFDHEAVHVEPADGPLQYRPPIANAGADIVIEVPTAGSTTNVTLDGSESEDPDGGTLTYSWYIPGEGTLTGVSPTFTNLSVGTYQAELTVTDDEFENDDDTVRIEVLLHAPTATIDNILFGLNPITKIHQSCDDEIDLRGTGADTTYTISSYQWRSSRDGILGTTEDVDIDPRTLRTGKHKIYFKVVNDQGVESAEAMTELYVAEDPDFRSLFSTNELVGTFKGRTQLNFRVKADALDLDNVRVSMYVNPAQSIPAPTNVSLGDIHNKMMKEHLFKYSFFKEWDVTMCTTPRPKPGPSSYPEFRNGAELHEVRFEVTGTDEAGWDFAYMVPGDYPAGESYELWLEIPGPRKTPSYMVAYSHWLAYITTPPIAELAASRAHLQSSWISHAIIAHDPFWEDNDFQTAVSVAWPDEPPQIAGPSAAPETAALYELNAHSDLAVLAGNAYYEAGSKMMGAIEGMDPIATHSQGTEALRFSAWYRDELLVIGDAFEAAHPLFASTPEAEVQSHIDDLLLNGFPTEINQAMLDHGMTQTEIDDIATSQVASDIVTSASLDLAAYPRETAEDFPEEIHGALPDGYMYIALTNPRKDGWARGTIDIDAEIWDKEPDKEWSMVPTILAITIDGNPVGADFPVPWDTTLETEGSHTVAVGIQYADTALGLVSDSIDVMVDNTSPTLTIVSPTATDYDAGIDIPVTATVADNLDTNAAVVCILLDGQRTEPPLAPPPGAHTVEVIAADRAGNMTTESVSFNVLATGVTEWRQFR